MNIVNKTIICPTKGAGDLLDITSQVAKLVSESRMKRGSVLCFVGGSTAGLTTFEFEPGLIEDMRDAYEKLAPSGRPYHHDLTWNDANGFSHVRAAFTGPSLVIPFDEGGLLLGQWQQIVLAEFDTRPRKRTVVVQITGIEP